MRIIALLMLLFSCCSGLFTKIIVVNAQGQDVELYNQDDLKISCAYDIEEAESENTWHLTLDRQVTNEDRQQRLKLKLANGDNKEIDYSRTAGMEEEEGWLTKKDYTSSKKIKLTVKLPKETTELIVTVQIDEKLTDEDGKETLKRDILPRNVYSKLVWDKQKGRATQDSAMKEIKETTASSVVGPTLKNKQVANRGAIARNDISGLARNQALYTNKDPEYTEEDPQTGTIPVHSWKPTNSEYVLNHQGGIENQSGWDGNIGWSTGSQNLTNSYIHYGFNENVADKASLSIRKMAMATDKEDEFDIRLNVRGQTNYEPGLDIVLVLDNSKSTNTFKSKMVSVVKELVDGLVQLKSVGKANIRVGAQVFSSWDSNGFNPTMPISENTSNWQKIYGNDYYAKYSLGATHTQRGLMQANDLFDNVKKNDELEGKTYNRKKMILLLTDGAPTESWKPSTAVADSTMFYDPVYVTKFDDKNGDNSYKEGEALGSVSNRLTTKFSTVKTYAGFTFRSHITTTNSTARYIKEGGAEVHTIAVNIEKTTGETHTRAELIKGLYLMASKKANAPENSNRQEDYFFRDVDLGNIDNYVDEWYKEISHSVSKGQLNDTLGDMVDLVNTPEVKRVAGGNDFEVPNIQLKDNRRRLYMEGINLYKGQEIQIDYKVKLRTGASNFVPGKWYQANGKTTLAPSPERSPDVLDFAVPSVRTEDNRPNFEVSVEKKWEDARNREEDFWGLRSDKVTAILQKKIGSNWVDEKLVDVTKNADWKAVFDSVLGNESQFRVIEKDRVKGYATAAYDPATFTQASLGSKRVTMTNKLLTTNYTFKKYSHDGQTPFKEPNKPKFKVTRQAKNGLVEKMVVKDLEPSNDGTVKIEGLPIGSYLVEEGYVPVGHSEMVPFIIEVTENDAGTGVTAKVVGQGSQHKVVNKLNDFQLIVSKIDQNNRALNGATFKLTGPNGYNKELSTGSTFTFTDMQPGAYTLTEEKAPKGYVGMSDSVIITIMPDGSVNITNNAMVTWTSSLSENKIEMTVKNRPDGVLPSTGGRGVTPRYIIVIACIMIGISLMSYLYIIEKKYYPDKSTRE